MKITQARRNLSAYVIHAAIKEEAQAIADGALQPAEPHPRPDPPARWAGMADLLCAPPIVPL